MADIHMCGYCKLQTGDLDLFVAHKRQCPPRASVQNMQTLPSGAVPISASQSLPQSSLIHSQERRESTIDLYALTQNTVVERNAPTNIYTVPPNSRQLEVSDPIVQQPHQINYSNVISYHEPQQGGEAATTVTVMQPNHVTQAGSHMTVPVSHMQITNTGEIIHNVEADLGRNIIEVAHHTANHIQMDPSIQAVPPGLYSIVQKAPDPSGSGRGDSYLVSQLQPVQQQAHTQAAATGIPQHPPPLQQHTAPPPPAMLPPPPPSHPHPQPIDPALLGPTGKLKSPRKLVKKGNYIL